MTEDRCDRCGVTFDRHDALMESLAKLRADDVIVGPNPHGFVPPETKPLPVQEVDA